MEMPKISASRYESFGQVSTLISASTITLDAILLSIFFLTSSRFGNALTSAMLLDAGYNYVSLSIIDSSVVSALFALLVVNILGLAVGLLALRQHGRSRQLGAIGIIGNLLPLLVASALIVFVLAFFAAD